MPINKKYNINKLLKLYKNTQNTIKQITIEYILIKNINDTKNHVLNLIKLLKNIKCTICLIPLNNIYKSKFSPTNNKNIIKFQNILKKHNLITNIRKSKGAKINAACGQLSEKSKNNIIKYNYFINKL